jgi:hypothetical protein
MIQLQDHITLIKWLYCVVAGAAAERLALYKIKPEAIAMLPEEEAKWVTGLIEYWLIESVKDIERVPDEDVEGLLDKVRDLDGGQDIQEN